MPSQDKLIKQGINYTDSLFGELSKRLEAGVRSTDTLEAFLDATKEFTAKNPLISSGYDETMLRLILQETNNHRFSRPSQKELVRVTIEENVGELISDVGEDIKESVRDIVKEGYNNNLSQDEIASNISNRIGAIKNTRARTIARTEIARTATVSDYIINKERGATHFYVECRNTACPVCKEAWHTGWTIENDNTYSPSDSSAGGKGWIGDKVYSMNDTSKLPPIHPNCRCVPYFVAEDEIPKGATIVKETPTTTTTVQKPTTTTDENLPIPTPTQLKKNLKPGEREKYNSYHRNIILQKEWLKEHPNAPANEIAKHQKRLAFLQNKFNELRQKALGDKTGGSSKPKKPKTVKPETPKPKEKPKPTPKPKEKPKTTTKDIPNSKLPKPTNKQSLGLSSTDVKKENSNTSKTGSSKPKNLEKPFDKTKMLTKEKLDKMDFKQLAEHHGAEYQGVQVYDYDGRKYHVIKQTFKDGREFTLRFEDGAVKSYTKKGIATPNEIIHEVFKVPEAARLETREIWFKNTNQGIRHTTSKSGYDSLQSTVGGYNTSKIFGPKDGDFDHRIVINPKYFKGASGRSAYIWVKHPDDARGWKMTIHHEFTHSGDKTREMWRDPSIKSHSIDKEYRAIENEERGFTWYANTEISESYAEHGGYVSYMESNPSEQNKLIDIKTVRDGKMINKKINYNEYKEMYPKHYKYFIKKFNGGF